MNIFSAVDSKNVLSLQLIQFLYFIFEFFLKESTEI